jgi:glutamate 5-kinase
LIGLPNGKRFELDTAVQDRFCFANGLFYSLKMEKPVLVIKIGSSIIADSRGNADATVIQKIVAVVAQLSATNRVILVSSGAVSSGKNFLKNYKGKLVERKAAAAIGNPILITEYSRYFAAYNIQVAQALFERHHFSNRHQFLQVKDTITELWKNDIVTIVNENDFVSSHELKFSDNDELATLIAVAFNAETMILCTTSGGYLNSEGQVIPVVQNIDNDLLSHLRDEKSKHGTGGMASKLSFTRLATSLGIRVIMCGIKGEASFLRALRGDDGTTFKAKRSTLKDRQKWLASGSVTIGSVRIDDGAGKALSNRKSLLAIGIVQVQRPFSQGEVVELVATNGESIGVSKMKLSSAALEEEGARHNLMAAHADDIVIF